MRAAEIEAIYKPNVSDTVKNYLVQKMLDNVDGDKDGLISYDEWVLYLTEAEKSEEYTVEHLTMELNWFLKGRGASRVEQLEV